MILSYHPEYSEPGHFIKISQVMTCPVAVNLMLLPTTFEQEVTIAEQLYNSNIAVWPKIIVDKMPDSFTNTAIDYSDKQKLTIKQWPFFRSLDDSKIHRGHLLLNGQVVTANDLIMNNQNCHQGWLCWSGVDQINVSITGDIYRADCQVGGSIGTIEKFTLPTEPQTCTKQRCSCLSDIYIRKRQ